jgi:hypothetical protein
MIPELKAAKALEILRPNGGWAIYGDDFDTIVYDEGVTPITQKEFTDAMNIAEQNLLNEVEAKATARQSLLTRLGITEEEARILLVGNKCK